MYAVEPHPDNYRLLEKHIKLNEYKNVEPFPVAIGSYTGEGQLNVSEKANWHSFRKSTGQVGITPVQMLTGDEFLQDKEPVTFVRMDLEGYELEVLRSMSETLSGDHLSRIFIELHCDILSNREVRELMDMLQEGKYVAELIIKHDRPLLAKILPTSHLKNVYDGDKGTYEIFFKKGSC